MKTELLMVWLDILSRSLDECLAESSNDGGDDDDGRLPMAKALQQWKRENTEVLEMIGFGSVCSILNYASRTRFFGNVLALLVDIVFNPPFVQFYLMEESSSFRSSDMRFETLGAPYVPAQRAHDILSFVFHCVCALGVRVDVANFYGQTPADMVREAVASTNKKISMPDHIRRLAPAFLVVLTRGPGTVTLMQRGVRRFIETRRKRAVSVIETWWQEVCLCPYTRVGHAMLQRRTARFYAAAAAAAPLEKHGIGKKT